MMCIEIERFLWYHTVLSWHQPSPGATWLQCCGYSQINGKPVWMSCCRLWVDYWPKFMEPCISCSQALKSPAMLPAHSLLIMNDQRSDAQRPKNHIHSWNGKPEESKQDRLYGSLVTVSDRQVSFAAHGRASFAGGVLGASQGDRFAWQSECPSVFVKSGQIYRWGECCSWRLLALYTSTQHSHLAHIAHEVALSFWSSVMHQGCKKL